MKLTTKQQEALIPLVKDLVKNGHTVKIIVRPIYALTSSGYDFKMWSTKIGWGNKIKKRWEIVDIETQS